MFSFKQIVIFLICIQSFLNLHAQIDSCGVYLTTLDYINRKLTRATNCNSEKASIKPHEFWSNSKYITLRYRGAKYKYGKAGLFGFRDCRNHDYRFFIDSPYEIINRQYFVLYRLAHISASSDFVGPEFTYFFSKTLASGIYPLNKRYLKWAYRRNKAFASLLDSVFQKNDDLPNFDERNKEYRVIQIYRESVLQQGDLP